MRSEELRRRFVGYFEGQGHVSEPSASLIPHGDPSVLFTSAGMQQFTPYFVGVAKPPAQRLVTIQRCIRTDDIEEVGDDTHHTFFEMLGNFSFGDYFKKDAVAFAYEFVTKELGLPTDKLWATIFKGDADIPRDSDAESHWKAVGIPTERIRSFDRNDNWWELTSGGPCGPCSEIYLDRGPEVGCGLSLDQCGPNHCSRFVEAWNLVFNQYNKSPDGDYSLLERTGIDTGAGFERLVSVLQGKMSPYETDLFVPLMDTVATKIPAGESLVKASHPSIRIIADHLRAATFLIADGVIPSNEGRGYVARRLIRRAKAHSWLRGGRVPMVSAVARAVTEKMGKHYPSLLQKRPLIESVLSDEEARFVRTLDAGISRLKERLDGLEQSGSLVVSGDDAFALFDTFGFPLALTEEIANSQGMQVDTVQFEHCMAEQRHRSRSAQQFRQWQGVTLPEVEVVFQGYDKTEVIGSEVLWIQQGGEPVLTAESGSSAMVVLDRTPFYSEGGGQLADCGKITGVNGSFDVRDTQRLNDEVVVHVGDLAQGYLAVGERVHAKIQRERRAAIAGNHSATHLLHAVLRTVLGEHVQQSGSLVAPDRLRFDFSHRRAIGPTERREIEQRVNSAIRANIAVEARVMPLQEALGSGALALFDERYGDQARVIAIGDLSRELCGGTHVAQTGDIGAFMLVSEGSIGSGIRRVEAVTGSAAEATISETRGTLEHLGRILGVAVPDVVDRVEQLRKELVLARRQITSASQQADQRTLGNVLEKAIEVNGAQIVSAEVDADDMRALRDASDWLRDNLPRPAAIILGSSQPKGPQLLVVVDTALVKVGLHAGTLLRQIAQFMGGKGGGRPDMAQGGGGDASQLSEALASGGQWAATILRGDSKS